MPEKNEYDETKKRTVELPIVDDIVEEPIVEEPVSMSLSALKFPVLKEYASGATIILEGTISDITNSDYAVVVNAVRKAEKEEEIPLPEGRAGEIPPAVGAMIGGLEE